jgi:major vault protein
MRALRTFTDESDETRRNGEEWLITSKDTEAHIPNVYEEVMICNTTTICPCQGGSELLSLPKS